MALLSTVTGARGCIVSVRLKILRMTGACHQGPGLVIEGYDLKAEGACSTSRFHHLLGLGPGFRLRTEECWFRAWALG